MQKDDIKIQWRNGGLALGATILVILAAFSGTLQTLVMTWWDKPEYNHCLLILPIIAYLIYERREIFQKIAPEPCLWGLIPLLGGGMIWLLGDLGDANVVREFGLILLIQGSILTILGIRVVRALLFPLFYMIFLIPFGNFLIPMLQDYTTWFVVGMLNLLNIPVFVEGVYLSIPAGDFHVAEACAGLRFLVATVALGTLMANVAYKTVRRQIIVVILSFIVPIIANGFRASGIILVAHWSDMKYAVGADHLTFGWIFFAIVLLIFISIAMLFTNRGLHDGYTDFTTEYWSGSVIVPAKKFILFAVMGVIFAAAAPYYVTSIEQRYQTFDNNHLRLEGEIWGEDVTGKTNWTPYYAGASQTFHQRQGIDAGGADIFVAYYQYQSKDAEMIRYGNGVVPEDLWGRISSREIKAADTGLDGPVNEVLLQSGPNRRLVLYWYWVDGQMMANSYQVKLVDTRAKLLGGRLDSAIIALSVVIEGDDLVQKREQLVRLAANLPPMASMVTGIK